MLEPIKTGVSFVDISLSIFSLLVTQSLVDQSLMPNLVSKMVDQFFLYKTYNTVMWALGFAPYQTFPIDGHTT